MNLRQKLIKIYEELDHVEKAGRNTKQGYNFVRSADVLREVRKAFAKHGVYAQTQFQLLSTYDIKTNSGGNMHTATVQVNVTFLDSDSEETVLVSGLGDGADSGDKGIYKAMTGATKNALRNALLLPDEADPEADETVDEETKEVAPQKNVRQKEQTTSTEQSPLTVCVPLVADANGPLPTKEELDAYRQKVVDLTKELSESGELKPSRGQRVGTKVLNYILKETKASEANLISINEWERLFSNINIIKSGANGLKELAAQIETVKGE